MVSTLEASSRHRAARFQIDPMSEHDLLEVVEIEESCRLSLWGWDAYRAELDRPESIMLVARRTLPSRASATSRLYGFIAARVYNQEVHINNIGVRVEDRRQGIGSKLLRRALRVGAHYGARAAILEVRAGNETAQALYGALGFAVVGRRAAYYRQPEEDALIMSREIETIA